ncbi:MAG: hypothetical protein HY770_08010, partial [Chitinivibrionia bacterium]|nr:hypothetical protein [Chitinivibrionia bacterium]
MTRPFSPILYPLACLVLLGFHLAGVTRALNPGAQFLLTAVLFFFLPGDILARHLFRFHPSNIPIRVLVAVLGGLSLHAVAAWLFMMYEASFAAYLLLARACAAVLLAVPLIRHLARPGGRRTGAPAHPFEAAAPMRPQAVFLAAALIISVFFMVSPGTINPAGDAFDHIGYTRRIVADDALAPQDVVAPAKGGEAVKHDPRKGALHPILALWGESSGLDPALLWTYLSVILAPAAFLSFVLFSFAVLPGPGYVLAATALFVLFQGGIGREYFATVAYGQNLSLVFLWMLAAFSIAYLRQTRGVPLGLILFLAAGGALMHFGFLVQWCLLAASLALFAAYQRFARRTLVRFALGVSIVAGAIFAWKAAFSYGQGNIMHMHPQGLLYVGDVGVGRFIVSPIEVLRTDSLVFLGGIVLLPG